MTEPKNPEPKSSRPARFRLGGGGNGKPKTNGSLPPDDRASTLKVTGTAEPRPPRSIDGHWEVMAGPSESSAESVFVSQVVARQPDQITAKVKFDTMDFHVSVRACSCCGRPFVTSLLLVGHNVNVASMWSRDRRLDVGMACYGIAERAGLRGLLPAQP